MPRVCTICTHTERDAINQALARRYNVVIGEALDAWQAEMETALDWSAG